MTIWKIPSLSPLPVPPLYKHLSSLCFLWQTRKNEQKFPQIKASIKFVPRTVPNPSSFSSSSFSPPLPTSLLPVPLIALTNTKKKKEKNHPKQSIYKIRPWLNAISLLLFLFFQFLLSSKNISFPCASDDAHKQGKTSRIHPQQSIHKSPFQGKCKTPSFSSSSTSVSSSHIPHHLNQRNIEEGRMYGSRDHDKGLTMATH